MSELVVGIQGSRGAFHERAAYQMFGSDVNIEYIPAFDELFATLRAGEIGTAVAAIANVDIGFIDEPHDELVERGEQDYWITAETYVPVAHQLLGLPGATLEQITTVHSMSPALRQCSHTLRKIGPHFHYVEESDTAFSAELVRELGDPSHAAVASQRAGKLNGLETIESDVHDSDKNMTRFLSIKRRADGLEQMDGSEDKSTVLLVTPESKGALYRALEPFDSEGINIDTLHSSFVQDSYFDAQFFMEFEAGLRSSQTKKVLEALRILGCDVKELGSYHKQPIPMMSTGASEKATK